MGKLGETKLAKRTIDELRRVVVSPTQKAENEISFGEFMKVFDPSIEGHIFTYPIPDHHNFLNLQIYNALMMRPFVVLKLEHPLIYQDGLTLEFHFGLGKEGRSIQCSNDFLYTEIMKLEREQYDEWEWALSHSRGLGPDKLKQLLEEKEIFRREYFPQPIIEAIERERKHQKSLGSKESSK